MSLPVLFSLCVTLAALCMLCALLAFTCVRVPAPGGRPLPSFSQLMPYACLLGQEAVALKNGALCLIYELTPHDLSLLSAGQREALRRRLQQAAARLSEGSCLHFDVISEPDTRYYPEARGGALQTAAFDELRRLALQEHPACARRFYLTLTRPGPLRERRRLVAALMRGGDGAWTAETGRALTDFMKEAAEFENVLGTVFELRRLGMVRRGDLTCHEGIEHIVTCLEGRHRRVQVSEEGRWLDSLLCCRDFRAGYVPEVGGEMLAVVAVDGLPSELDFNMLGKLFSLGLSFRFSTRFIIFDDNVSRRRLTRVRRMWQQKIHGLLAQLLNQQGAQVNENALRQVSDVDEAICSLDSGENVFGSYSAVLILRGRDGERLQRGADLVCRTVESLGFGARVESINATDAFIGSLPGETRANLRRPMISSQMLSCLLAAGRSFQGHTHSPNPLYGKAAPPLLQGRTLTGESFLLNLHVGDLGNTVVAGPPGSGKSVLLGEIIIALLRYRGMRVFAFDKDRGLSRLCRHYGGTHIAFDGSSSLLCPLEVLGSEEAVDFARDYLELLCRLSAVPVSPQMQNDAAAACRALAPLKDHSLSALYDLITNLTLKDVLEPYLSTPQAASLLDGERNPDLHAPLTVFECADLFGRSPRMLLPVLRAVFRVLHLAFNGQPAAIVMDEAWIMLKDEVFAAELISWFKTLRKFNVLVIMATQSVTDFSRSGIFTELLDCAKTRIFLPNSDAGGEEHRPVYRRFGLTDAQIEEIRCGMPGHDYFLSSPETFQGFCLDARPEELRLLRPEIGKGKAGAAL